MIAEKFVDLYARNSGLRDKLIAERDVVLTYALRALVDDGVMNHLAFKGGTCLRKLVFGSAGRFSEDTSFGGDVREHEVASICRAPGARGEYPESDRGACGCAPGTPQLTSRRSELVHKVVEFGESAALLLALRQLKNLREPVALVLGVPWLLVRAARHPDECLLRLRDQMRRGCAFCGFPQALSSTFSLEKNQASISSTGMQTIRTSPRGTGIAASSRARTASSFKLPLSGLRSRS